MKEMTNPLKRQTKAAKVGAAGKPRKPTTEKAATKKPASRNVAAMTPLHPLMLNGQSWNRGAVMEIVFRGIASSSRSITTILKDGHEGHNLPTYSTIMEWLAADNDLSDKYARAKADQADFLAEEMLDIADDGRNDFMEKVSQSGEPYVAVNQEHIARSRLRIETRKWLAGKLRPKRYGDKLDVALDVPTLTPEQRQARIQELLKKAAREEIAIEPESRK